MVAEYDDLSPLARTYLGVVALGLPSARLAGDERFRIDYITAVCEALVNGRPATAYLEGEGPEPVATFLDGLRRAVTELDALGAIIAGAGGALSMLPLVGEARGRLTPAQVAALDLNQPPKVLDSYLSHRALDALLAHPDVYPFLMERYALSSEVWQRLAAQGYIR